MSKENGQRGTERKDKVIITAETKDSGRKRGERDKEVIMSQKTKHRFFVISKKDEKMKVKCVLVCKKIKEFLRCMFAHEQTMCILSPAPTPPLSPSLFWRSKQTDTNFDTKAAIHKIVLFFLPCSKYFQIVP